jgi:DNA replication protein DnaC
MNAQQIDQKLEEIGAGKHPTPPPASRTIPPLEDLMRQALEFASTLEERLPEDEQRALRTPRATEIRDRLPSFLRKVKPADLERFVGDHRLRDHVRGWRVGQPGLLLLGKSGVGKSAAAGMLFRRLLGTGWRHGGKEWEYAQRLRWFSAAALSQARREHPLGQGEAREISQATHASLLVIDDAGWDNDTQAVAEVLAARYEKELPTVMTSGCTVDELSKHYSAAVMRRFAESGGTSATVVDCFAAFPAPAPDPRCP